MMRIFTMLDVISVALAGCASIIDPAPVNMEYHVGGRVHGLWDGAGSLVLQLLTDVDPPPPKPRAVTENGAFDFKYVYPSDTTYITKIMFDPPNHKCIIEAGGSGRIMDMDITNVSVGCTGPGTVMISGPSDWIFDPTQDFQTFRSLSAVPSVVLTIAGSDVDQVRVGDIDASVGQPVKINLLPGSTQVPVYFSVKQGLFKTYYLKFDVDVQPTNDCYYSRKTCIPK